MMVSKVVVMGCRRHMTAQVKLLWVRALAGSNRSVAGADVVFENGADDEEPQQCGLFSDLDRDQAISFRIFETAFLNLPCSKRRQAGAFKYLITGAILLNKKTKYTRARVR